MSEENEPKEIEPKGSRILFCYFVVVLLLGLVAVGILFRAFDTAFVERDKWMKVAESQKRPNRLVLPGRGNIYSSDGKLMATSVPRYYMYIDFKADAYTPAKDAKYNWLDTFKTSKKDGVDSLAFYLSRKLKDRTPAGYKAYLLKGLSGKSRQFPIYAGKVSYSDLKEIRKFPFLRLGRYKSGFYTKEMVQRQKPFGTLASRTIGDIYGEIEEGGTTKGKNGLELQYDSLLRGQAGLSSVRRVGGGWTNVIEVDPVDGMDIRTTIDINIQDITEKSLVDKLKAIDAESGTAVVMEVETGEIKAITNMGRIREGVYGETKNHAVADEIEPGSTIKVASIMVALEDGFCNPGDTILVPNPGYPMFEMSGIMAKANLEYYTIKEENGYLPDLDHIPEETLKRAKYMIVSYPLNPVCVCAPDEFYPKLIDFAKKNEIVILHDNAYSDIIYTRKQGRSFLSFEGAKEVGVEFYSLSKSYNLTGARISFVVGNREIIEKFRTLRSQIDYGIFLPIQYAAIAALTGPDDFIEEQRQQYEARNRALCGGLRKIGWNVPDSQGTMFVWAKIPEGYESSADFCIRLMERTGVIVTPGSAFGSEGEGYVRMALVVDEQMIAEIIRVLDESGIFKD